MKKTITLIAAVLLTFTLWAQSPEKMSYQAVVRNTDNQLVKNQPVGMQISILHGAADGPTVYTETQTPTTNASGLVSIEIGGGTVQSGDFATIDWANGPYFIKTETDPSGGTNYSITGTSQLLSVPYALHSKTAETITGVITETDPAYLSSEAANITTIDITNLGNLSGTNTGDETAVTIKTKLGITTLSGTNTGDQNLADVAAINNLVNTQLKNVSDPTESQDAATKAYVDVVRMQVMNSFAKANETFTSPTTGTIKDIDNNTYATVKIGNQWWMAANLKTTKYNDGTAIDYVPGNWNIGTPSYCWYDNDDANKASYGAIYNGHAAFTGKLCPLGWHVPNDAEWNFLFTYLGGESVAGYKLKESGWLHWNSNNADNSSGFTALPGGVRDYTGEYYSLREAGCWWSLSMDGSDTRCWYMNSNSGVYVNSGTNTIGRSTRCLRD